MKIEKNKLVKVNYSSEEFIGSLFIKNVEGLILDTIRVYGYMHNERNKKEECPYSIDKNDINIITTITPGGHYDRYILKAMRVINADVIKIDADDYLDIGADMNGNYEFVLNKESGEINL
nr:MAG TPA: hypothetical protein [Caudoviricetes sp.]